MSSREMLLTVSIVLIMGTSCAPIGGNTRTLAEPIPLLPTHYAATATSTISAATSNATIAPTMQQRYQSDFNAQCPKISEKTPLNLKSSGQVILRDYQQDRNLWALNATNGATTQILDADGFFTSAAVSPDQRLLAYRELVQTGKSHICVLLMLTSQYERA